MRKLHVHIGQLCLYFFSFIVGIWAENLLPEKQCILMGNLIDISIKLMGSIALCLLALFLSHYAEKSLLKHKEE